MDVDEEIEQLEDSIRKLQGRADLLRRVRENLPAEKIAELHARFVDLHRAFREALETFSAESADLFDELALALGDTDENDFDEWVTARGLVGDLFTLARDISEEFCEDTNRGLYYEARKELEELFLELREEEPERDWFERLLRREGQLEYDEKMSAAG